MNCLHLSIFLSKKNKALSTIKIIEEDDDDVVIIQRSPNTYQIEDKKYQRFNSNVILVAQKTSENECLENKFLSYSLFLM